MNDQSIDERWLESGIVRNQLRIDSCHLMHLRVDGKLRFKKEGNAFLYYSGDVHRLRIERSATAVQT